MKSLKIFVLMAFLWPMTEIFTNEYGARPGQTNAPGESACGGCHGPAVTSGNAWNSMQISSDEPLNSLSPNTSYPITLSFSDAQNLKYGFMVSVLPDNATKTTGSLGELSVLDPEETQSDELLSPARNYILHTTKGTFAKDGKKSWTFTYTTPPDFAGNANFYVVVNSTNGDGSASGDQPYAKVFNIGILPVKWLDIQATKEEQGAIQLSWATAEEINNKYFEVEGSENGIDFEVCYSVSAPGQSSSIRRYEVSIPNASNKYNYMRVRQVDFDGRSSLSKIITLPQKQLLSLNPTVRTLPNGIRIELAGTYSGRLLRLDGVPVLQFYGKDEHWLETNGIQAGIYILQIEHNGKVTNTKVYIQ